MPKCTICISPFREKIDIALASGASVRNVAKQFNVGVSSVQRHKADGHICDAIKAAERETQTQIGLNISKCAQDIYDLCYRAAQKAENEDLRSVGPCIAPAVKVLEILNKGDDKDDDKPGIERAMDRMKANRDARRGL